MFCKPFSAPVPPPASPFSTDQARAPEPGQGHGGPWEAGHQPGGLLLGAGLTKAGPGVQALELWALTQPSQVGMWGLAPDKTGPVCRGDTAGPRLLPARAASATGSGQGSVGRLQAHGASPTLLLRPLWAWESALMPPWKGFGALIVWIPALPLMSCAALVMSPQLPISISPAQGEAGILHPTGVLGLWRGRDQPREVQLLPYRSPGSLLAGSRGHGPVGPTELLEGGRKWGQELQPLP